MLGWPGSEWAGDPQEDPPTTPGDWADGGAEVRHTFTHFHLRLKLRIARLDAASRPQRGAFIPDHAFRPSDLPTVMRKAFDLASPQLRDD